MLSTQSDSRLILQHLFQGQAYFNPTEVNVSFCATEVMLWLQKKVNQECCVKRLTHQQKWKGCDCEENKKLGRKMVTRLTARYDYTTECPARWEQEISYQVLSSLIILSDLHIIEQPHTLWGKSKLGSLYSVLLRVFHFGLYFIKLTFTFLLFDDCINCRQDEVRMILCVSPV